MFIISLTYICDLEEVDDTLQEHVVYLKEQYKEGNFIASGRKIPRTGGIILSKLTNRDDLNRVLAKDPFNKKNLARYDIEEFVPSMTNEEFKNLLEQ